MTKPYRTVAAAPLWLALLLAVPHAAPRAEPAPAMPVAAHPFDGQPAVDDSMLAAARGGFDAGNGLLVSLSIDRLLSLNGDPVASSSLALRDVGAAVHGGLPAVVGGQAAGAAQLWQTASGQLPALVLQNAANGQLIRSLTTIDAAVNSLPALKNLNFGDSLRQSLSTAVMPR
ncbi:hypothetical protein IP92_04729 [Pseudoduganella flava]|uniref:Uncharacterized protein n=1 Tax=Pseudoduganella flava TaxID=871742 RepID=A0A562PI49_9BURK|nr:hypothetical protein [Pseudoduganella flava]QGZ42526.1 hypothetical protein GO485_28175 [Pseudoduganella flava]TWI43676.1 hypothetical protein IP92_04729 [Pseudoduganella flava]